MYVQSVHCESAVGMFVIHSVTGYLIFLSPVSADQYQYKFPLIISVETHLSLLSESFLRQKPLLHLVILNALGKRILYSWVLQTVWEN